MAFSQYFAEQILAFLKGQGFPTALTNVYITLHTADPGTAGTNGDATASITGSANRTELSSPTGFGVITGASPSGFEIKNTSVVQITTSAVNTVTTTITHFGIWDDPNGPDFIASGTLTSSVDIALGDTVQFNIGAMAIKVV